MVKKCNHVDGKSKCCEEKKSEDIDNVKDSSRKDEEFAKLKNQYIRLLADSKNYRSWVERNKAEWMMSSSEQVLLNILPIVDELERVVDVFKNDTSNVCKNVTMILNHFYKVLSQYGVKKIDVKNGDVFNEEYHEAIDKRSVEKKEDANKIVEVVEDGYILHDKVMRYTKVIISYCDN